MRTVALAATAVALAAAPASALAQAPPAQQPAPPAAPPPAAPKIAVGIQTGMSDRGHVYVVAGQKVVVTGRIKPFAPGQSVVVELFHGKKRAGRRHAPIKDAGGGAGKFAVAFRARRSGSFSVRARHPATPAQPAAHSAWKHFQTIDGHAGSGSGGEKVRLLQRGLGRLAYVTSHGGRFDDATGRAVLAFRKVNGMSRTESANSKVFAMVFAGRGGFRLRYPKAGKHVEFDWSRQVLVLADHGRPERIYHASSGKPSTPTVFGTFSFYSKTPGTNQKGMYDSNYFFRGYAVHGYPDVPPYAASHGCIRVPNANAASIFGWIRLGDRIFVYR